MPLNKACKITILFITTALFFPFALSALPDIPPPTPDDSAGGPEIFLDASTGQKYVFDPSTQQTYRIDSNDELIGDLEVKIAALESSKQDLSIWITIFVTSVILIIGINIGLSVWQVGSIAQREAEDYMKEYEKNFQNVISETIAHIDDKVSIYETNLNELVIKINELGPKFEASIGKTDDAIGSLVSFSEKILKDFKEEANKTKSGIIDEMEKWQERKIKKISPAASD